MKKITQILIVLFVCLIGVSVFLYHRNRLEIQDFAKIYSARKAIQNEDFERARSMFPFLSKRGHYLRGYALYDAGIWYEVQDYAWLSPHPAEYYLLGNTRYRMGDQDYDLTEKIDRWEQSLMYYKQASEQKQHPWIDENIRFVQDKLDEVKSQKQTSSVANPSQSDTSNQGETEEQKEQTSDTKSTKEASPIPQSNPHSNLSQEQIEQLQNQAGRLRKEQEQLQNQWNRFGETGADPAQSIFEQFFGPSESNTKDW